jgi:sugar lactone lactonase YvrE
VEGPLTGFLPVAKGIYLEGLSVDTERGVVWYSDVIGGGIHRLRADGAVDSFNTDRRWTGGIILNDDGCVLSSGPGGIAWLDPRTGATGWLVDTIDGEPVDGINEMIPDGTGGIYFGTVDIPSITRGEMTRPASLYRRAVDGTINCLHENRRFVNGLMLSPDGRKLYSSDTFDGVYAYDVLPDRTLGSPVLLFDKKDCDGMALDCEGSLWVTGYQSSALTCLRPDGSFIREVSTPGPAVTQIRFGGTDYKDFYITTVPGDAGDGLAVGTLPEKQLSTLYRGRSNVAGLPIPPTRFKLR